MPGDCSTSVTGSEGVGRIHGRGAAPVNEPGSAAGVIARRLPYIGFKVYGASVPIATVHCLSQARHVLHSSCTEQPV